MLGWKELAAKVDSVYDSLSNKEQTLIFCDNYGQAAAINYYSKNKNINAVSFNADYINWIDLEKKVVNYIRVKEAEEIHEESKKTSQAFEISIKADSITNPLAREYKTTIFVFSGPRIDINKVLTAELEKKKTGIE